MGARRALPARAGLARHTDRARHRTRTDRNGNHHRPYPDHLGGSRRPPAGRGPATAGRRRSRTRDCRVLVMRPSRAGLYRVSRPSASGRTPSQFGRPTPVDDTHNGRTAPWTSSSPGGGGDCKRVASSSKKCSRPAGEIVSRDTCWLRSPISTKCAAHSEASMRSGHAAPYPSVLPESIVTLTMSASMAAAPLGAPAHGSPPC